MAKQYSPFARKPTHCKQYSSDPGKCYNQPSTENNHIATTAFVKVVLKVGFFKY